MFTGLFGISSGVKGREVGRKSGGKKRQPSIIAVRKAAGTA